MERLCSREIELPPAEAGGVTLARFDRVDWGAASTASYEAKRLGHSCISKSVRI